MATPCTIVSSSSRATPKTYLTSTEAISAPFLLRGSGMHFFIETGDGVTRGNSDWKKISMAFSARFESKTRQDEASAVLDRLRIIVFRTDTADDRADLTTVISMVESTAPVALLAQRYSHAKTRFVTRAVNGTTWSLHASFRLPSVHTNEEFVDYLLHTLRTLRSQRDLSPQPQAGPFPSLKVSNWDKFKSAADTLLGDTLEHERAPNLFS